MTSISLSDLPMSENIAASSASMSSSSAAISDRWFVAAPDQVFSELGGEAVIMHLQSGTYFGLNEVGASIWQQLQNPQTLEQLCDAVQAEYDVSLEVCQPDIEAMLQQFQDACLIEVLHEQPG